MIDANASISDFLSAAAAKEPTPGGGAVAALAGALAASMGEMVLAYSVGKKDLAEYSETNKEVMHELFNARKMLLQLMVEDQVAYSNLNQAMKSAKPQAEVDLWLSASIAVPQSIGTTALVILELGNKIVRTSNKWLLSDLAVCGELATATVRCAVHNILVNLPQVKDESRRKEIKIEADELIQKSVMQVQKLIQSIREIQAQ